MYGMLFSSNVCGVCVTELLFIHTHKISSVKTSGAFEEGGKEGGRLGTGEKLQKTSAAIFPGGAKKLGKT